MLMVLESVMQGASRGSQMGVGRLAQRRHSFACAVRLFWRVMLARWAPGSLRGRRSAAVRFPPQSLLFDFGRSFWAMSRQLWLFADERFFSGCALVRE